MCISNFIYKLSIIPLLFLIVSSPTLLSQSQCKNKILFVRGGPGTGQNGDDEQLADINNYATNTGNHGWGEFADLLTSEGYTVEQIEETQFVCNKCFNGADFLSLTLSDYNLIVFGSNNAFYINHTFEEIDLIESYIRSGGAALFISDGAFGNTFFTAPFSDQNFLDRFGWTMNQDAGTYTVDASEYTVPNHRILENVASFDGEGVSPITLTNPNFPGVASIILAQAEGQVRRNDGTPGTVEPVTANDAALIVANVDDGRIAGHFDRNTFFNLNGAGTDINKLSNEQLAKNLVGWLTNCDPDPLKIPGVVEAEDYTSQTGIKNEVTSDFGGGLNLGFIQNGDETNYSVNVVQAGTYDLRFRVASDNIGGTINVYFNGNLETTVQVANTGGWQSWQTITSSVELTTGIQDMTIEFTGGNGFLLNFNWLDFNYNSGMVFQLVNSNTGMVIRNLPSGVATTIDLAVDGTDLNIIATLDETVGSVLFDYDGSPSMNIENVAPYALAGDMAGNFNSWTPALGFHNVSASAYESPGATDCLLDSESTAFVVINSCPAFIDDTSYPTIIFDLIAGNYVSTNGILPLEAGSIEMSASQYVELTPEFDMAFGTELLLHIEGCN